MVWSLLRPAARAPRPVRERGSPVRCVAARRSPLPGRAPEARHARHDPVDVGTLEHLVAQQAAPRRRAAWGHEVLDAPDIDRIMSGRAALPADCGGGGPGWRAALRAGLRGAERTRRERPRRAPPAGVRSGASGGGGGAGRSPAGAARTASRKPVTGLILATSVIAVLREYDPSTPGSSRSPCWSPASSSGWRASTRACSPRRWSTTGWSRGRGRATCCATTGRLVEVARPRWRRSSRSARSTSCPTGRRSSWRCSLASSRSSRRPARTSRA